MYTIGRSTSARASPQHPPDAEFMGLRFRIGYRAHAAQEGSKDLGGLDDTHQTNFLY